VVTPGLVRSELWGKMGRSEESQKEFFEKAAADLPVGFVATPDDIAEAYLYLVKADYATGTSVEIGEFWLDRVCKDWLANDCVDGGGRLF
jgi:NAD(P)-dependent dehydrogenase (short-subunit alcohol dehydrogenase family)